MHTSLDLFPDRSGCSAKPWRASPCCVRPPTMSHLLGHFKLFGIVVMATWSRACHKLLPATGFLRDRRRDRVTADDASSRQRKSGITRKFENARSWSLNLRLGHGRRGRRIFERPDSMSRGTDCPRSIRRLRPTRSRTVDWHPDPMVSNRLTVRFAVQGTLRAPWSPEWVGALAGPGSACRRAGRCDHDEQHRGGGEDRQGRV